MNNINKIKGGTEIKYFKIEHIYTINAQSITIFKHK